MDLHVAGIYFVYLCSSFRVISSDCQHTELTVLETVAPTFGFDLCTPVGPLDVHLKSFLS